MKNLKKNLLLVIVIFSLLISLSFVFAEELSAQEKGVCHKETDGWKCDLPRFEKTTYADQAFCNSVCTNVTPTPTRVPTPTPTATPTPIPPLSPCAKWVTLVDYNARKENAPPLFPKDLPKYKTSELKCIAINTAIGEISTEPQGFVKRIFSFVLGIAGGIALILIIISGYRMMASQGNPEALTAARDQLTSAIVGLLFIIFSFVILQVIGVDILRIPGFAE